MQTQSVAEATWSSIFSGGGDAEAPVPAPTLLPPPPPDAPAYTWMLSPAQRARGLTYLGSAERLRAALHKAAARERGWWGAGGGGGSQAALGKSGRLHGSAGSRDGRTHAYAKPHACIPSTGKQLTVSVIGGSISAGAGAYDVITDAWVDRLEAYLKELLGAGAGTKLLVNNGAVPGAWAGSRVHGRSDTQTFEPWRRRMWRARAAAAAWLGGCRSGQQSPPHRPGRGRPAPPPHPGRCWPRSPPPPRPTPRHHERVHVRLLPAPRAGGLGHRVCGVRRERRL